MSEPSATPTEAPETPDATAQPPKEIDWEAEARKWEKRSKDNYAKLKEAEPRLAELDQIKAANQTEAERQAEELARWQADSERWRTAALTSRVEALAGDFADPTDALGALGDTAKYLDAGGQIDDEAIRRDLDALLERKPHWRRPDGAAPAPRIPAPNPAQGSGGGTPAADPAAEFASILRQGLHSP